MAAITNEMLNGRLDKMATAVEKQGKLLEQLAKPASKAAPANVVFGADRLAPAFHPNALDARTNEKLYALSKAYGDTAAHVMGSGKGRLIGWGPMLEKMARKCLNPNYDYDDERLEKEFKIRTVEKARTHGVEQMDGTVRKSSALAENSGATGGYVIPPQFMTDLLTVAAEDAFIEKRCKALPMASRTVDWPMLDVTTVQPGGTAPYFGGVLATWQPEAATITETEPTFRSTTWTAWDLVFYTVSSNQLLADNGVGLDALLTQLFGQAITYYKELAFINGKGAGASMPLGILNAPATLTQSRLVASHITWIDLIGMMSKLHVRSWDNACWIAHQSCLPELMQLYDTSATPGVAQTTGVHIQWLPPLGEGGVGPAGMKLPRVLLNSLPLFFSDKLPKLGTSGCLILADLSMYVVGSRLDYQLDVSPHFKFQNNQLAWRVICRCDGKPWLNSFITDQAGYQSSPFVYLTQ